MLCWGGGERGEGMRADRLDEDVLAAFFYFAFSFFKTRVGGDEMLLSYAKDRRICLTVNVCVKDGWNMDNKLLCKTC